MSEKKSYLLPFVCFMLTFTSKAQSGFDALWKKYDSIQKVDAAKKNPKVSEDYKSIPTIDARKEAPKADSVVKQKTTETINKTTEVINKAKEAPKNDSVKIKEKIVETKAIPAVKTKTTKEDSLLKNKLADKSVLITKPKQITEKPVLEKPVVKTPAKTSITEEIKPVKKSNFDTTKNFKDFSFETTPIVNGNATYNKPDPVKPIGANEIDEKIPVNKTITSKESTKEDVLAKSNYSAFSKEAETIRRNNDRKLDSVLKTMQLNIPVQFNPNDYIDIYVNGGSVLKDNNSKMYDRISILNAGRIHREYKTKNAGDQRVEKNISREQLVKLAQYIIDLGFFDFKASYDCDPNDAACNERLTKNPVALPLQITVTIGERKSKVYVAVYSLKSEKNWVNYPDNLDKIITAIYSIVEK
ncbi:MAG: hypothetical protein U0U67_16885 [Chitinophagales bacterium]